MISRSSTLVITGFYLSCLYLCFFLSVPALAQGLSVLQGFTDETSSEFVIQAPMSANVQIQVTSDSGRQLELSWLKRVPVPGTDKELIKFAVESLSLKEHFQMRMLSSAGEILDERTFDALNTFKRYPKVALASCMVDWLHNPGIWDQMEALSPDLVLFVGDTTYVDISGPGDLVSRPRPDQVDHWKRFSETRDTLQIFKWKHLKPILAMADDHDFGYNNAESDFPLKNLANHVFQNFFAQSGATSMKLHRGPGNSMAWNFFGLSFIMLDGRNFRDAQDFYSLEQRDWIESLPLKEKVLLMSGTQFFGAYLDKDSYEGERPSAFQDFLEWLKTLPQHFAFASGDIHFSEVMKIMDLGYESFEVTSSSVHSFTMPGRHVLLPTNPRRVPGKVTSTHNFVTLQWDALHPSHFTARSHGWRGQDLFECELLLQ